MSSRIFFGVVMAFVLGLCTAPVAQAQVKAKSAFGDSAISAKYSDSQLSGFIRHFARLAQIDATYSSQPRMGGGSGMTHPGAPKKIIDDKNKVLQDNKYYEMARYLEDNGTTVNAFQAVRLDINRDTALKKRFKYMARDMGYKSLEPRWDPFKDAPPYISTY